MAEKETHQIRNGIIAGVVVAIIALFLPAVRNLLFAVLSWVWGAVKFLGKLISDTYQTPGWLILIFIALAVPTCIRLIGAARKKKEPGVYDLYHSDLFFGPIWEWSYIGERIINLNCICPKCKGELIYEKHHKSMRITRYDDEPDHIKLICENCGEVRGKLMGQMDFALGTVEREIRRKIRTGEWKESIEANKANSADVKKPRG